MFFLHPGRDKLFSLCFILKERGTERVLHLPKVTEGFGTRPTLGAMLLLQAVWASVLHLAEPSIPVMESCHAGACSRGRLMPGRESSGLGKSPAALSLAGHFTGGPVCSLSSGRQSYHISKCRGGAGRDCLPEFHREFSAILISVYSSLRAEYFYFNCCCLYF